MASYSVPFTTWANTSVVVEVPDDVTDPAAIIKAAERKLYDNAPGLCNQCSGGYRGASYLEIGDEWEVPTHDGAPDITRTDQQETER